MVRINNKTFSAGKLRHELLAKMLNKYVTNLNFEDERIIMGSKIGEDAAVIDMGSKYLVAKTDPITFTTNEIGYYAVNVNVNDVACTGAEPKWFQSTILLPEKNTTEEMINTIFKSIHDTCKSMNITVIGGHTEITPNLDRPIVVGSLLGEVVKDKLVLTSGAKIGDALILTKGIFIEGTSIIGREKEDELKQKGLSEKFIERCKNYLHDPGISVIKEARLANENFEIHSFHDVTEGGLFTAIAEMAIAAKIGVSIQKEEILVLPEPRKLSDIYDLNPYNTISSGSLLIAVKEENSSDLIHLLTKNGINSVKIGNFISNDEGLIIRDIDGRVSNLKYSEIDDITKIFNSA